MHPFLLLLKKKGIGASMGKHLEEVDLPVLSTGFLNDDLPLTSKATLLIALLCLDPTPIEAQWIDSMKASPSEYLPKDLHIFLEPLNSQHPLLSYIHTCIEGKDLSYQHCSDATLYLFDDACEDYIKAAFLEAERLKRENLDENRAFLDVFYSKTNRLQTDIPVIIDLANPYDGFNRHYFLAPFIAATLGALGFPTLLHGIDDIGPKYGVNPSKLLKAYGATIPHSHEEAKDTLIKKGWAYIDQATFIPELYNLKKMRTEMLKRPVIATVEKFLQPLRAQTGNILITGYTHPAYKEMTHALLKTQDTCDRFLFFRGTEGSPQLSLDRRAPFIFQHGDHKEEGFVSPEDIQFKICGRIDPNYTLTAEDSLIAGLEALAGKKGFVADTILYNCISVLKLSGLNTTLTPDDIRQIFPKVQF